MRHVVVDASVVAKLFSPADERHVDHALELADAVAGGAIAWRAPRLLQLEVLNVAARKWHLREAALAVVARELEELDIHVVEPELPLVAAWSGGGLTAYDAAYVALAEQGRMVVVTDDDQIVATAPDFAVALGDFGLR